MKKTLVFLSLFIFATVINTSNNSNNVLKQIVLDEVDEFFFKERVYSRMGKTFLDYSLKSSSRITLKRNSEFYKIGFSLNSLNDKSSKERDVLLRATKKVLSSLMEKFSLEEKSFSGKIKIADKVIVSLLPKEPFEEILE